jgi:demethylmenaquinone methyltransferase / 2-methoxy-6-polyprenyl-1,4-benzoquinol methylase
MISQNQYEELMDKEHAANVREMFGSISHRYDLMNRIMTGGQDVLWRKEVIRRANLFPGARLLDLGAGTGDLVFEALKVQPQILAAAADFTIPMMEVGRNREGKELVKSSVVCWTSADALDLPYDDSSFDAVVSGFLLRNVTDLKRALQEQVRVLRPGGTFVALDTTRPPRSILAPIFKLHMHLVIPALGRLLTGHHDAYLYLPTTTENFLEAEKLAAYLQEAGLMRVGFNRLFFGAAAVHWGSK